MAGEVEVYKNPSVSARSAEGWKTRISDIDPMSDEVVVRQYRVERIMRVAYDALGHNRRNIADGSADDIRAWMGVERSRDG